MDSDELSKYTLLTLNASKNIPDIIPSVHRVLPWDTFLPLLDEKNLLKTGSNPRTPGFIAKHPTTALSYGVKLIIYIENCVFYPST